MEGPDKLKNNYRIAYDKYWSDIKRRAPEEIAAQLSVTYSDGKRQFIVTFFNSEFILDCDTEKVFRKSDGYVPEIMASIIMLNYLAYAHLPKESPKKWVSLKELPNGGMLFYPAFYKNSILSLIKVFGHQSQRLLSCSAALGGHPATFGDASAVFQAFPEIPLCVIIWEGDEDVRSNATMLFEPSIEDFLHIESAIGLGMYLADKLTRQALSSSPCDGSFENT